MRIIGIVLALVLAVSLVVPAAALAQDEYAGLSNCAWDKVKWQDNENSWGLYLQHWGRTPIQAMSRLSGLCGPKTLCAALGTNCPQADGKPYQDPNACFGGCPACRVEAPTSDPGALATCSDPAACNASLSSVSCPVTGQAESTCPSTPVVEKFQPTCGFCWGISLAFAGKSWAAADIGAHPRINNNHLNHFGTSDCSGGNHGGDWGITGAPHTECCSLTWALQDNCFGKPYGDKCAPN
ncbi:MAG: hypothetical protein MUP81_06755 [Dehalococcoidia bacterium]|nr:hypothetical protein [Dehalococcoidia bacterium]